MDKSQPIPNITSAKTTDISSVTKSSTVTNLNVFSPTKQFNEARSPTTSTMEILGTTSKPCTPQPQKLFFKPGIIEEEEEISEYFSRADSPLMLRTSQYIMSPSISGLNRISTCNSTLSQYARQDSRRSRPGVAPRVKKRAVFKNGECNILQARTSKHRLRFLQDIFTTLVDTQWRWTLITFALSFLLSWLGFAVIWWLIAFTHGDFEEIHLPPFQEESKWTPCVSNLFTFTSCFLFSIETQHTIGYGYRTTTEECPEAIFIMCLQSIAGVMIQAFMVGIVFAKMTRPKHRTQTLLFSRNAVICQRDGLLCLMFRVGDMRKSHIIGASIRAQLIRPKTTKEGEVLSQYQTELSVSADACEGDLFFIWPMTIVHKIDADSPLYYLSPRNFLNEQFEIVVILEGTIESTGQTTQARSSFIANEVLWGHRFEPVVNYSKDRRGYEVNYSKFDSVVEVDTPLCSGYELASICMNPIDGQYYLTPIETSTAIPPIPVGNKIRQIDSYGNFVVEDDEDDKDVILHHLDVTSSESDTDYEDFKKTDNAFETTV